MSWEIMASIVGATVASLTFVFVVTRALLGVRKADMDELRLLSQKDMAKVLEVRAEDMEEIRQTNQTAHDDRVSANENNTMAHNKLFESIAQVLDGVGKVGARVGMIETWRDMHQRDDDRAHADVEVLKSEHRTVLQDISSLKTKERRSRSKRAAKRIK